MELIIEDGAFKLILKLFNWDHIHIKVDFPGALDTYPEDLLHNVNK